MALPAFPLEVYFSKWEFAARYNLMASDAQTMPLAELLALARDPEREAWHLQTLGYIPSRGTHELRAAIAQTYDRVAPEDVIVFAGAQEGLYCAMHALLDAGDHAVVLLPNYQSMEIVPRSICEVSGVVLDSGDGWRLNLDEVAAAIRPNTRVVAVNFPNNPTGKVIGRADFLALVQLCRDRNLWLFSDEVYRGIERDPKDTLPQACDLYERALSLNVLSKAYGLPGLRVGWIVCRDSALLDRLEQLKHYLSICNPGPSEILARIALSAARVLLERNRSLTAQNLALLDAFFARHAERFRWYRPEGSCVAYPAYLGADGVDAFCRNLVESRGVALLPGSIFASHVGNVPLQHFRIGYGRADMPEALAILDDFMSS